MFITEQEKLLPNTTTLQKIFMKLQELPLEFFLTGSRLFGGAEKHSDWDLYVEYTSDILPSLEPLGFQMMGGSYEDSSVKYVLRHYTVTPSIDIQVIKPDWMSAKIKANNFLQNCPTIKLHLWDKCAHTQIWDEVMNYFK